MKIFQHSIYDNDQLNQLSIDHKIDLVLLFVSPKYMGIDKLVDDIRIKFENAIICGCSTSGEISDINVKDLSVSFTAISFEGTDLASHTVNIDDMKDSHEAGKTLANKFDKDKLKHLFVLSDGLNVNGAELVQGLGGSLPKDVTVTGGLAGDGADFTKTFIINNNGIASNKVVGVGFYGDRFDVTYGSKGGWDSFGIERQVTRSDKNVLYELDGEPALDLYKSYLGDKAKDLPASGLLFPLSLRNEENKLPVVRTILAIDEEAKSLTFAGNIDEGSSVRLMKANIDRLILGAENSAKSVDPKNIDEDQLAILVSCVGRRLVLKQMVEEEVEAVSEVLGEKTSITGFYSYGEIAPFGKFDPCQLHNQTMTITVLSEKPLNA